MEAYRKEELTEPVDEDLDEGILSGKELICSETNRNTEERHQFEWAWQNPQKSRRLRHVVSKRTKEKSLEFQFRVLSAMLRVGPWNRLPLTIRWLKQEYKIDFDVNQQPPFHMPIMYGPLNKRKPRKGVHGGTNVLKHDIINSRCVKCSKRIKVGEDWLSCLSEGCSMKGHLICLAERFLADRKEEFFCLPIEGDCPVCKETFLWRDLLKHSSHVEEMSDENATNPHWAEELNQY